MSELETQYLASLNDRELQAYHIAKHHLGMTFNLEKSNGFRAWKKTIETSHSSPSTEHSKIIP
jgi:hypothetical protein